MMWKFPRFSQSHGLQYREKKLELKKKRKRDEKRENGIPIVLNWMNKINVNDILMFVYSSEMSLFDEYTIFSLCLRVSKMGVSCFMEEWGVFGSMFVRQKWFTSQRVGWGLKHFPIFPQFFTIFRQFFAFTTI